MRSHCTLVRQHAKTQMGKARIGQCGVVSGEDRRLLKLTLASAETFIKISHIHTLLKRL